MGRPSTQEKARDHRTPPQPPIEEDIRRRAYEIYEARRGGPGSPVDDWVKAERELRDRPRAGTQGARP